MCQPCRRICNCEIIVQVWRLLFCTTVFMCLYCMLRINNFGEQVLHGYGNVNQGFLEQIIYIFNTIKSTQIKPKISASVGKTVH